MDENFDGRISFAELKFHIQKLGFVIGNDTNSKAGVVPLDNKARHFVWRDKSIEVIIRLLHKFLGDKPIDGHFKLFDRDHDDHLTPSEFRQSLLALKNT